MASNQYKDKTVGKKLSNKVLNQMVWRSLFLQGSFNMERMQAAGWLYGIIPGLKEIHKDKDDLALSMEHNLEFFNTHPFLVTFVMGIVLSLEEQKADVEMIRSVRVAAMGPLGGIGDAIFWLTLVPITAGITSTFAQSGNVVGPLLFLLIFNGVQFGIRYFLMHWSYGLGTKAIGEFTKHAKAFTRSASILGVFVVGVLTATFGGTTTRALVAVGEKVINVQTDVLDVIVPKLIPLVLVLILYYFFSKKRWTPIKGIGLLVLIGAVGTIFGIFGPTSISVLDADNKPVTKTYYAPLDLFRAGVDKANEQAANKAAGSIESQVKEIQEKLGIQK